MIPTVARVTAVSLALFLLAPGTAHASEPRESGARPTPLWLAAQALPSPSFSLGEGGAHFGLAWQITPILYSWGIHEGLSPWRLLTVEPNVRQSGSVELYVSPEVHFGDETLGLFRPGVRAYFPLVEHGEYLSCSVGASYQDVGGVRAATYEVGAYVLFGVVGLQQSFTPDPDSPLRATTTLRFRYF